MTYTIGNSSPTATLTNSSYIFSFTQYAIPGGPTVGGGISTGALNNVGPSSVSVQTEAISPGISGINGVGLFGLYDDTSNPLATTPDPSVWVGFNTTGVTTAVGEDFDTVFAGFIAQEDASSSVPAGTFDGNSDDDEEVVVSAIEAGGTNTIFDDFRNYIGFNDSSNTIAPIVDGAGGPLTLVHFSGGVAFGGATADVVTTPLPNSAGAIAVLLGGIALCSRRALAKKLV